MVERSDTSRPEGVAIIGDSAAAIQAALTLAQMGVEVKVVTSSAALGWNFDACGVSGDSSPDQRYLWPLLLRAASHPLIKLYSNAEVERIEGQKNDFKIEVVQQPRYIHEELCSNCGRCQAECSVKLTSLLGEQKIKHNAIHTPLLETKSVPSAYVIDKNGVAPCHAACPLGINVQGFVSLLANGKTDRALALINEVAPLAGILGRVCKHPCEESCRRAEVDSPVFIQALHRYAADSAPGGITYNRKAPAGSREGRIAIVGSGPAGLAAAWELTRRGYTPTVFESHSVIGGMLATGIPRFRLPREVRGRDIDAIINLGVDIRTGITVGRDVTLAYLRERGYRAFFIAIGCQQNSRLNIPGEELEGVVDCMSLLLTLNLRVDTFVGSNIVIIGDGNSAVDSARAAIRRSEGSVKVLSWTVPDEITAVEDEVKEALQEGVSIEFGVMPVEVLGEDGKVAGVRCQRTRLTEELLPNGRHRPEPIPGTDFVIEADHVVVAIGQSPDTSQLRLEGLDIDSTSGAVQVNPLTLEASIRGVFAGGDCITGPNNVVAAMAAGLRAAESIDRYFQGHDLEVGRSLELPEIAEIDVETVEAAPYQRASMPAIRSRKRKSSFEETTTGLPAEVAQMEAQRCLNCAMCSQCLECTRVCELNAVFHDDCVRHFEVGVQFILRFPSDGMEGQEASISGIRTISAGRNSEPGDQLIQAIAAALETAIEIQPNEIRQDKLEDFAGVDMGLAYPPAVSQKSNGNGRIGVFLCRCGGSIDSIIGFRAVSRRLSDSLAVTRIREIAQACTEEGAREIAAEVAEWQLDGMVLAACRCCNSEQVCYSCTDRRQMCQQYLNQHLILPQNTTVEFVNIREQCAWVHKDDPRGATRKAIQIILAGVNRVKVTPSVVFDKRPILPGVLVIGGGTAGVTAAGALASRGYEVGLVARQGSEPLESLPGDNFTLNPWPDALKLQGYPGNYEVLLQYGSQLNRVNAGAVLVDMEGSGGGGLLSTAADNGLISRIMARRRESGLSGSFWGDLQREVTITETAGLFLLSPDGAESSEEQLLRGLTAAARVSAFLEQKNISPRAMAVSIARELCRGCGDCSHVCPYIEMKEDGNGVAYACIDKALCLGCGACIAACPTGAITQAQQSDARMVSTLQSLFR